MEVVFETESYRIFHEPGNDEGRDVILAFTGIGHGLGGVQRKEFFRSIKGGELFVDTYYVIDRNRSWYNDNSCDLLRVLYDITEGRNVYTIGNSMGGFGAVLFGRMLRGCRVSIAFCPQYSVHPQIADFEIRWKEYTSCIRDWVYPTCLTPKNQSHCFSVILFGRDDQSDMKHQELLKKHNENIFIVVDNCGHDVASYIKNKKVLSSLIGELFRAESGVKNITEILNSHGVDHEIWQP